MSYQRRVIDDVLDELFPYLAAIGLEGAKAVGKTHTASERATTVLNLAEPSRRQLLEANLDYVPEARKPLLIDEWQLVPPVWDRVRRAVDDNPQGEQFILAGSAGVEPGARIHSGAGRIVSLRMRPLSFAERNICEPQVSLRALLKGESGRLCGDSPVDLPGYTDEILRSGFPGIRALPERARNVQLDSYLTRIVERELPENGIMVRQPRALMAWLSAYGAATATDAAYTAILAASTPGEAEKPARQTVASYREHLQRIFVLDPVEPWIPAFAPLKRLTKTPKHHLVDPALAARLGGVSKDALLAGEGDRVTPRPDTGSWLGALFESLATQSIRVYADAADALVGHLRTKETDHEVDLIVEAKDRSVVACEVKLSATVSDKDVRHLNWLAEQLGERLVDRIVVTTGTHAYRRRDGVGVVPLSLLGP